MKTKYPSMFGVLAALLLVASSIIPTNLATPSPVEAGICKWDTVNTPGAMALKGDIQNLLGLGSENLDMVVGGDGATVLTITKTLMPPFPGVPGPPPNGPAGTFRNMINYSNNMGITFSGIPYGVLYRAGQGQQPRGFPWIGVEDCYQGAIAPEDPKFWAVTTDMSGGAPIANKAIV